MGSDSGTEAVIRTVGLTKQFKDVMAVQDLDLTVRRGEIYGFLGRNGAGKTTTIRMLLALIRPTDGYVEILGQRMAPNAIRAFERVGSMVETPGFYGNLTVRENIELQRDLLGLRRSGWVDEVVEMCDLGDYLKRKAQTLSGGMKQRLGLARALIHKPEILILDEPTNGLDPVGIVEIRTLLKKLSADRGITVFLSSHILSEIQLLATRIGIIDHGRLLEEIDLDDLRRANRSYLEFTVSDTTRAAWVLEERCAVRDYVVHEEGAVRVYDGSERAAELNRALIESGVEVTGSRASEEGLEDHFVRLTGADEPAGRSPRPGRRGWRR
jgi:bacitracin transport system ATP-binding protein